LKVRIEERTVNLQESNEKLSAETAKHKRTTKELEKRNYELDNYVYKVSYDLRVPLTSILGLMNLIQSETDPETIRQYTNLIGKRALKLDDFIQSIFNFLKTINSAFQITEINSQLIINQLIIKRCVDELKYLAGRE
jgi:light-regulated signal transduction histidine kinase (bacteriophytochrome)